MQGKQLPCTRLQVGRQSVPKSHDNRALTSFRQGMLSFWSWIIPFPHSSLSIRSYKHPCNRTLCRQNYLACISQSLVPIRWSHTQTKPSSPPLTIFQSSIWTADTPNWWAYREHRDSLLRRSNTLTLNESKERTEIKPALGVQVVGSDSTSTFRGYENRSRTAAVPWPLQGQKPHVIHTSHH